MPRIWLMYLQIFAHPLCPAPILHTHARRTFDRALRTLPPSLHARIWPRYLLWAEARGGMTTVAVYRRYLHIDPSLTERYINMLLSTGGGVKPRPLEAAKLLLKLARKASRGEYTSPEGKSPYQLLGEWLDVVEKYADEVGMDADQADALRASAKAEQAKAEVEAEKLKFEMELEAQNAPASTQTGKLIRFGGPPVPTKADAKDSKNVARKEYDEDEDPGSERRLDVEGIVKQDGLAVYKDQGGRLWSGLAIYWTKRGEFERVRFSTCSSFSDSGSNYSLRQNRPSKRVSPLS